jgi:hypothetical protein
MIIYTLRCNYGKFYVGKTNNIKKRYEEHDSGIGSRWTNVYKPIEIFDSFESFDSYDEDKQTLKMMSLYGIENVRGSIWTNLKLYPYEIKIIQRMIYTNNDQCFQCGDHNHFIRECPEKNNDYNQCYYCGHISNPKQNACLKFLSSFCKFLYSCLKFVFCFWKK